MLVATKNPTAKLIVTWPLLPDDFQLPDDPVEDESQPLLAAALRQPLTALPELVEDALIVSNFALCAGISFPSSTSDEQRTICKAPDWMYVKPVNPKNVSQVRRSYTPHTEGTIPQIVMEFLSETYGKNTLLSLRSESVNGFFTSKLSKYRDTLFFGQLPLI